MCGIVGYTGEASATPIPGGRLTRMEYRGYDSAGVAVEQDGGIQVITRKGRPVSCAHPRHFEMTGTCGIGHTRWPPRVKPSEVNAHPHCAWRHRRCTTASSRTSPSCSRSSSVAGNASQERDGIPRQAHRGGVLPPHAAEGTGDLRAAVAEAAARGSSGPTVCCHGRDAGRARSSPAVRIPPSWWAAARLAATWPPTSLR